MRLLRVLAAFGASCYAAYCAHEKHRVQLLAESQHARALLLQECYYYRYMAIVVNPAASGPQGPGSSGPEDATEAEWCYAGPVGPDGSDGDQGAG